MQAMVRELMGDQSNGVDGNRIGLASFADSSTVIFDLNKYKVCCVH